MVIVPPYVDRIWGIWYMGSHYKIPKAIFYLLKGDYTPLLHCPALPAAQAQALTKAGLPQLSRESAAGGSFFFKAPCKVVRFCSMQGSENNAPRASGLLEQVPGIILPHESVAPISS